MNEEIISKICRDCKIEKPIDDFEKNQVGKDNRIIRRPTCKECRSVKVKMKTNEQKEYNKLKPKIGDEFTCPICNDSFIRQHKNDVVLDHNHLNGSIRGFLCGNCNTGLGRFKDNIETLQKAIQWLKGCVTS